MVNLSIFFIIHSQTSLAKQVTKHKAHTHGKDTFKQQQDLHKSYIMNPDIHQELGLESHNFNRLFTQSFTIKTLKHHIIFLPIFPTQQISQKGPQKNKETCMKFFIEFFKDF
jgi:hypothetical protein